jgi:hypothetical protein
MKKSFNFNPLTLLVSFFILIKIRSAIEEPRIDYGDNFISNIKNQI